MNCISGAGSPASCPIYLQLRYCFLPPAMLSFFFPLPQKVEKLDRIPPPCGFWLASEFSSSFFSFVGSCSEEDSGTGSELPELDADKEGKNVKDNYFGTRAQKLNSGMAFLNEKKKRRSGFMFQKVIQGKL